MKKTVMLAVLVVGILFVALCLAGCLTAPYTNGNDSSWRGGYSEPREVVGIPDSGVYFVPQLDVNVFFYNGYWWSPRGDQWYRSREYNGPWGNVERRSVPDPVYRIPNDYRTRYEKEQRIPYGQWKNRGKDNRKEDKQGPGQGNGNRQGQGRD